VSGDCFAAAWFGAKGLAADGVEVLVAHGLPRLAASGPHEGERFWHAWVEVKVPAGAWHVIDASNGLRVGMKRTAYYRAGRIDPEEVLRYTVAEAEALEVEWGHAGPWVENAEALGLFSETAG
jgi:transglutaminase-like putative cysteine protease